MTSVILAELLQYRNAHSSPRNTRNWEHEHGVMIKDHGPDVKLTEIQIQYLHDATHTAEPREETVILIPKLVDGRRFVGIYTGAHRCKVYLNHNFAMVERLKKLRSAKIISMRNSTGLNQGYTCGKCDSWEGECTFGKAGKEETP